MPANSKKFKMFLQVCQELRRALSKAAEASIVRVCESTELVPVYVSKMIYIAAARATAFTPPRVEDSNAAILSPAQWIFGKKVDVSLEWSTDESTPSNRTAGVDEV
ncbi:hypothetical protein CVT26_003157 [Gymnopilus dilepis]|uniref:Uncharacterized protein n=1 Tax=Gymnopilus dilepis TaxID=231916 RepID=A0A409X150_9AGAR|nr:hypothetical protein CVT26_003157 [Gymnopilus dilepis]